MEHRHCPVDFPETQPCPIFPTLNGYGVASKDMNLGALPHFEPAQFVRSKNFDTGVIYVISV